MRIALCLSGQPRTWRFTRDSLMGFFAGHDLDVYLHTWREGEPAELEALVQAYAPRAHGFEARPLFVAEKRLLTERFPAGPPLTIFDMFHSVAASLALAAASGAAYDLLVRARFDALFDGAWSGEAPDPGALVLPDGYPQAWGCNDQFALGAPADMAVYGEISAWLRSGAYPTRAEGQPRLQPERLLRHYLESVRGLDLDLRSVPMKVLRESQAGRAYGGIVDDPLFHAAKHEAWEAFAAEQFPDLASTADFDHVGRIALDLERALAAWLESHPQADGFALLRAPWPRRIQAVAAFIAAQGGEMAALDAASYDGVRAICAMLLQRMDPTEPMTLESWVLHALSANIEDMNRAAAWIEANLGELERLDEVAPSLGPLEQALTYANPLEQRSLGAWRPRQAGPL